MAEPDDLLSKADALMARHHPGRAPAAPYAEIPVLDEIVDYLPENGDLPLLTETVVPAPVDKEQALAASIRASLLLELQPRIDALIAERVNDGLAPLVEKMFDELRGKYQRMARESLSEAINAAVERALARRK